MGEKFIPDAADPRFGDKNLVADPRRPEQADFRNFNFVNAPAAVGKKDMLVGAKPVDPWGEYLINPRAHYPETLVDFGPSAATDLSIDEAKRLLREKIAFNRNKTIIPEDFLENKKGGIGDKKGVWGEITIGESKKF